MIISVYTSVVKNLKVDSMYPYLRGIHEINRVKEEAQYKFYKWIGWKFNDITILDLGTRKGTSAVAFADNPNNQVVTYDNRYFDFTDFWEGKKNLVYKNEDVLTIKPEVYNSATVIHLDLWHNGEEEEKWLSILDESNFDGFLIMDDVDCFDKFPRMQEVFKNIQREKIILPRSISHFTGTGIVFFGNYRMEVL